MASVNKLTCIEKAKSLKLAEKEGVRASLLCRESEFSGRQLDRIWEAQEYFRSVAPVPLEPEEFLKKWCKEPLSSNCYKKACDRLLAEALGVGISDPGRWGSKYQKRPEFVPYLLRLADLVLQARELGLFSRTTLTRLRN